jgi:hypothetical protein
MTHLRPHRPRHSRRTHLSRPLAVAAVGALAASALVSLPGTAQAFGDPSFAGSLLRGAADGGSALLANGSSSILKLAPIARQSLGCNPSLGSEVSNTDDEVNAQVNFLGSITLPIPNSAPALLAKQLRNTGYVTASDTEADVYEKATSSYVNLLNGAVTATTLQETAHTRLDASGYFNEADAIFQDLYVDPDGSGPQQPIAIPHPTPNQTISFGPLGSLVLNEQIPNATGITANALHFHVGDYAGFHGDLYVGHVETTVSKAPARISGFAFSSQAAFKPLLASGKQALANLPCSGTGEKDKVVTGARLILPGSSQVPTLLDEGALKNIVNGKTSKSSPYSRSTSRIEALKALIDSAGVPLISADVIQTRAYTFAGFDRIAYDANGSKPPLVGIKSVGSMDLLNLVVNGNVIAGPVPPNTTIDLAGLGTLVLNEQRCRSANSAQVPETSDCSSVAGGLDSHYSAITVIGLHLKITVSGNSSGLPVGAELILAESHSDLSF